MKKFVRRVMINNESLSLNYSNLVVIFIVVFWIMPRSWKYFKILFNFLTVIFLFLLYVRCASESCSEIIDNTEV